MKRRSVFAGLVVVLAVLVTAVPGAQATQGQPVIAGEDNTAAARTTLSPVDCPDSCDGLRVEGIGRYSYGVTATGGITGLFAGTGSSGLYGVFAHAPGGIGVYGIAGVAGGHFTAEAGSRGTGLVAENRNFGGTALKVNGKTSFSRSGVLTVAGGATSVTRSQIRLSTSSFVLATLQTNSAGLYVQGVVTNPAGGSFTIYFSKEVPAGTKVAFLVMN